MSFSPILVHWIGSRGKKINIYQKPRYFMVKNHGFPLDFPSKGPHSPDFGPWLVRLAAAIAQVQLQLHQVHTTCDLGPWNLDGSHIPKKMLIPSDMDMFNIYICVCLCMCIYISPYENWIYNDIHIYIYWWYIDDILKHLWIISHAWLMDVNIYVPILDAFPHIN